MSEFPIEEKFGEMCSRVFRVEQAREHVNGTRETHVATAFLIDKRPTGRLILATAAHVFKFPKEATVRWKLQQFDDHSRLQRETSFMTNASKTSDVPYRFHKAADVGFVFPPIAAKCPDGAAFAIPADLPLPMIAEDLMQGIGTRVCWTGYPIIVEKLVGRPTLSYAEGVISSMVNYEDKHLYIVDGTNSGGFSGGPVWFWCPKAQEFQVLGVVSGYFQDGRFPGFCAFEPINHLRFYLKYWDTEDAKAAG